MIHWLIQLLEVKPSLLLRIAGATVTSFLIVMLLGPRMIRFLIRKKVGDRPEFDHADLNEMRRHTSNTPTMGGILIVVAIFVAVVLFADLTNGYIRMGLFALLWLGGLGAVDDWTKLRRSAGATTRDGLKSWQKILFQIGLAVLLSISMRQYGRFVEPAQELYLPFKSQPIYLPCWRT